MSLRKEIEIKVCEYGRSITSSKVLTDDIISIIEKRVDEQLADPEDRSTSSYTDGIVYALKWVKEMLK